MFEIKRRLNNIFDIEDLVTSILGEQIHPAPKIAKVIGERLEAVFWRSPLYIKHLLVLVFPTCHGHG